MPYSLLPLSAAAAVLPELLRGILPVFRVGRGPVAQVVHALRALVFDADRPGLSFSACSRPGQGTLYEKTPKSHGTQHQAGPKL